jgi:hypothetical protein
MAARRVEGAKTQQPGRFPSYTGTIGQMRRKLESFPREKALM